MSKHFFDKINYSASNEDSDSERSSLMLHDNDTVLCITGSGSRSLDLLIDNPKKIISIDLNATQNFLLELKIAAYKTLSYSEFCSFLGLTFSGDRAATYKKIKHELSDQASIYWSANMHLITKGVLYCGTWEKLLQQMGRFSRLRSGKIRDLMNSSSLEEQRNMWTTKWDNTTWRIYLKMMSNQFIWKYIIREPGSKLIPGSFNVYAYMKERLDFMGTQINMKQSHFANLVFGGKYRADCLLPHHLRAENFNIIKNNLYKIEVVTASLTDYLKTVSNKITAFSLSDFSSYADEEVYKTIWKEVITSAIDGAKFCERQFLVKKNPETLYYEIQRNPQLENDLSITDVSFIYTFCVGKIIKS